MLSFPNSPSLSGLSNKKIEAAEAGVRLPQAARADEKKGDDKKADDRDEKLQKQGVANITSALETIEKHTAGLAASIKLVKDKKLAIRLDATNENIAHPEVQITKDGEKQSATRVVVSLGLAALPSNPKEQAVLVGAMIKSLTLADTVNTTGKIPQSEKELAAFQSAYVKNLVDTRSALKKDGGKEALELAKGLDRVIEDIKEKNKK